MLELKTPSVDVYLVPDDPAHVQSRPPCVSQDLVGLWLSTCRPRAPAGPASPGFSASTAGRRTSATSAAAARPAFTATVASA